MLYYEWKIKWHIRRYWFNIFTVYVFSLRSTKKLLCIFGIREPMFTIVGCVEHRLRFSKFWFMRFLVCGFAIAVFNTNSGVCFALSNSIPQRKTQISFETVAQRASK